ncbi:unnamed protein product [Arabidopsis thaliana]|uniref:Uncharacterized protein n=1 Tax=Arabidopsis thaliana TaxID=3702 RepID=A0A654G5J6_ARATH|nr:unnamed protein product [Arabidopsis thaliana]
MANSANAPVVKSLSISQGRKRFVFKTFSQRIIDIKVFRILDKVKAEPPSEGSSMPRRMGEDV